MAQIITNNSGGGGGGGASYTAGNGIDITSNEISIDEAVVQTVGNMVDNLTGADDDHYPTAKAVADAISGGGRGNVVGPNSSTDGDIVLFDGATGKIIKDSGVGLSSKLDASALSNNNYGGAWENDSTHTPTKGVLYDKIHTMDVEIGNKAADNTVVKLTGNQTIAGTKTFSTSPVVPSKSTAATNTGTAIATEAQVKLVADDVATINGKIPSAATSSNQLADKNYVDDSINSVTAYYITKNAQGDQWATYAELAAASTFYSGGVARTPTRNDYTIVLADENHDNATTRYIYNSGWEYQYTVNETAMTQAQLDAINSGITSTKVGQYDSAVSTISGYGDIVTHDASEFYSSSNPNGYTSNTGTITSVKMNGSTVASSGEADLGTVVTSVKTINSNSITGTGNLSITEGHDYSWQYLQVQLNNAQISGTKYRCLVLAGANLNITAGSGLTPGMEYILEVNNIAGADINMTFDGVSHNVPNGKSRFFRFICINSTSLSYDGSFDELSEAIAGKQPTLVSGTNIKTINGNSILGSGNITVSSSTTITVTLTSAGWSSNSQTVSATGVTASNTVIVSPAPANIQDYADCGVYCSAQGSGTLTFGCDTVPSGDIVVNVLIMS